MDMKLELLQIPVTDIDRAKVFYVEKLGCNVDLDVRPGDKVRIVQLTAPGSARGGHLVVGNIYQAREALVGRGVKVSELTGPDRGVTYATFSDPDGNTWVLQELEWRSAEFSGH